MLILKFTIWRKVVGEYANAGSYSCHSIFQIYGLFPLKFIEFLISDSHRHGWLYSPYAEKSPFFKKVNKIYRISNSIFIKKPLSLFHQKEKNEPN